ncbi:hypothetical protein LINGRAHAP2_LOCUS10040 [Linum grandiflorum]
MDKYSRGIGKYILGDVQFMMSKRVAFAKGSTNPVSAAAREIISKQVADNASISRPLKRMSSPSATQSAPKRPKLPEVSLDLSLITTLGAQQILKTPTEPVDMAGLLGSINEDYGLDTDPVTVPAKEAILNSAAGPIFDSTSSSHTIPRTKACNLLYFFFA